MEKVMYDRVVDSEAMSKGPRQSGLAISIKGSSYGYKDGKWGVHNYDDIIKLEGINPKTKDITTHLSLEIPIENIDDVVEALLKIKQENEKRISDSI